MLKINDEFKIFIKKFSITEDKLKEQQKITKELRGVRNNYQEKILEYIEKNNLKNVKLNFHFNSKQTEKPKKAMSVHISNIMHI